MNPFGIVKVQIALVFISVVLNLYFMCGIVIDDCLLVWMKKDEKNTFWLSRLFVLVAKIVDIMLKSL